ncbi:MAG TPA: hypothetical protein VHJ77_10295 [Vicinamibacterales bacterium]|nr:hypothetical protein [Vicinamibacterales bacterium]
MQDQRVGCQRPFFRREERAQLLLDDDRIVRIRDADAVGDAQDMTIDGEPRHAQRVTQDDVGGLAADAGEFDELLHARRNLAPMLLDERDRHAGERLRFHPEEAGGLNLGLELRRGCPGQRARVRVSFEERRRDLVDALVGALRRQDRRDEQLVGTAEVELGERARVLTLELFEDLASLPGRLHAA